MNRQRGFTLLEMVVALAISLVMLALLFGGLSNSLQQWQRIDQISDEDQLSFLLQRHLRTQLQQTIAMKTGNNTLHFKGTENSLSFIAPLERANRASGLFVYELTQQRRSGTTTLNLKISPFMTAETIAHSEPPTEEVTLYTGPAEIKLAYASFNQGQELYWHDRWTQKQKLPHLVKISLADQAGQQFRWPELVVQVQGMGNGL